LKHEDYTRFIVLSRSRTGSNLLTSLLNSHRNIDAEGEALRRLHGRSAPAVIDARFGAQPFFIHAKGFKVFYYHPLDGSSDQVWRDLTGRPDLAVIHLRRRNILRTIISRQIADRSDEWLRRSPERLPVPASKAITISPAELTRAFEQTRTWEQEGELRFVDHRTLSIWYEDLVSDLDQTFATITAFLGVRNVRPRTRLRRQNPEPLHALLVDHEELHRHFQRTEWEPFFND